MTSQTWDLEVLGGLLLSRVAQLFIEAYCVKMRGGTLAIPGPVPPPHQGPGPASLSEALRNRLREAFRARDAEAATAAAIEAYGIADMLEASGVLTTWKNGSSRPFRHSGTLGTGSSKSRSKPERSTLGPEARLPAAPRWAPWKPC